MKKRLVHDMSMGCFLITHRITLENIYIVYYLDSKLQGNKGLYQYTYCHTFVECKAIKKEKCNNDAYYHLRQLLIIPRSIINPS